MILKFSYSNFFGYGFSFIYKKLAPFGQYLQIFLTFCEFSFNLYMVYFCLFVFVTQKFCAFM